MFSGENCVALLLLVVTAKSMPWKLNYLGLDRLTFEAGCGSFGAGRNLKKTFRVLRNVLYMHGNCFFTKHAFLGSLNAREFLFFVSGREPFFLPQVYLQDFFFSQNHPFLKSQMFHSLTQCCYPRKRTHQRGNHV